MNTYIFLGAFFLGSPYQPPISQDVPADQICQAYDPNACGLGAFYFEKNGAQTAGLVDCGGTHPNSGYIKLSSSIPCCTNPRDCASDMYEFCWKQTELSGGCYFLETYDCLTETSQLTGLCNEYNVTPPVGYCQCLE